MYRCNAWRLSAKSFVKISVRDSEVVGIAVLSVSIYATPIRGCTATLPTRMGVFVLSGVVRSLASEASGRRAVLLEGQGDYVEFTPSGTAICLDGNVRLVGATTPNRPVRDRIVELAH